MFFFFTVTQQRRIHGLIIAGLDDQLTFPAGALAVARRVQMNFGNPGRFQQVGALGHHHFFTVGFKQNLILNDLFDFFFVGESLFFHKPDGTGFAEFAVNFRIAAFKAFFAQINIILETDIIALFFRMALALSHLTLSLLCIYRLVFTCGVKIIMNNFYAPRAKPIVFLLMRRTAAFYYPAHEKPEAPADEQPAPPPLPLDPPIKAAELMSFVVSLLSHAGHTTDSSLLKTSFSKICSQSLH